MYVRNPTSNQANIKIPENYSGNVFRDTSPYGDMPPPARLDRPHDTPKIPPERHDKQPPREIDETPSYIEEASKVGQEEAIAQPNSWEHSVATHTDAMPHNASRGSIFSSLLPPFISSSEHFPFGHGLGSEELLIIAIMLMVFLSDNKSEESDHELLFLLGLLLFAG